MRNKKTFSFDEEKDAKDTLVNGFKNGLINYTKMYPVAKYIRTNLGYGAIRLERELIKFCKTQDKNFNPVREAESIKKWVRSAMNYNLRKIESVTVSQKEINFLKSIENKKDRKLLFTTLVLSKALKYRSTRKNKNNFRTSDNYYIHFGNFPDIISISGLKNISEANLASILGKYKKHITVYNVEKELIRIDYIDKNPKNKIELNLNKIYEFYETFLSENNINKKVTARCINCGKEIQKKNNNQKYCDECSKIIRKEKERNRKRRDRENMRNIYNQEHVE